MTIIQYPKLDPEKWANAKLTVKERTEVDMYVNKHGYTIQRVADMYNVGYNTVRYWSDPVFRAKDIARVSANKARKLENPEYAKKMAENRKIRMNERLKNEPMFRAWHATRGHNYMFNAEQYEKHIKSMKGYYQKHKEESKIRSRRSYRIKDNNGFRMFWEHINKGIGDQ